MIPTRRSHRPQKVSIRLEARKSGSPVWVGRFWESVGGERRRRKVILGSIEEIATREDAQRVAEPYRLIINHENPEGSSPTMEALIDRYQLTKLPARTKLANQHTPVPGRWELSQHHAASVRSAVKCWIGPKWTKRPDGTPYLVRDFESIAMSTAIEDWLASLVGSAENPGGLAGTSVRHIFTVMKVIFKYAVKWGYISHNPMGTGKNGDKLVELPRGCSRRQEKPHTLTPQQFMQLFARVPSLLGKLVLACVAWLGPRINEAFGLKWRDIDFLEGVVHFRQGIVEGRVDGLKTEASRDDLPLPPEMATLLVAWRNQTPYREPDDWVFASLYTKGQRSYWSGQLLKTCILPFALQAGLGRIGWNTFRHSYTAWGKGAGVERLQLQELLRHATSKMLDEVYGATDVETKRAANRQIIDYVKRAAVPAKVKEVTIQ